MSYDAFLEHPVTRRPLELESAHQLKGGTYALGGIKRAWLNITYNYSPIFQKVLGKDGIEILDGMTAADSIPILEKAVSELGDDVNEDYWEPTEGNAKMALCGLLSLAKLRPDGIWRIR